MTGTSICANAVLGLCGVLHNVKICMCNALLGLGWQEVRGGPQGLKAGCKSILSEGEQMGENHSP